MTEIVMGGPRIPQTCAEALWPDKAVAKQSKNHVREVALWQMAPQLREALLATILPENAKIISLTVEWQDGPASSS